MNRTLFWSHYNAQHGSLCWQMNSQCTILFHMLIYDLSRSGWMIGWHMVYIEQCSFICRRMVYAAGYAFMLAYNAQNGFICRFNVWFIFRRVISYVDISIHNAQYCFICWHTDYIYCTMSIHMLTYVLLI